MKTKTGRLSSIASTSHPRPSPTTRNAAVATPRPSSVERAGPSDSLTEHRPQLVSGASPASSLMDTPPGPSDGARKLGRRRRWACAPTRGGDLFERYHSKSGPPDAAPAPSTCGSSDPERSLASRFRSDRNDLDMGTGRGRQRPEIIGI